jgi:hypothetical protein
MIERSLLLNMKVKKANAINEFTQSRDWKLKIPVFFFFKKFYHGRYNIDQKIFGGANEYVKLLVE